MRLAPPVAPGSIAWSGGAVRGMEQTMTAPGPQATHEVRNQVPPLAGHDVAADPALLEAVEREEAGWVAAELHELGRLAGTAGTQEQARLANEHPPVLRSHDRYGNRVDEVEFHPAWHALMETAVGHGLHATPWVDHRPGAHVARAAKFYVWSQAEAGHGCPISMTYAVVPALRHAPELAGRFEPLLVTCAYDPGLRPPEGKRGLLSGMAMTEKQGGSDVRANTTRAEPVPGAGAGAHLLTGHKWFCSAPMCDLFLTLAQAPAGLTCFLLPRVLPGGDANPCACNGSRTSSATGPTPRPRSSSTARWPGRSVSWAAAWPRSSRWSARPGWTASSAAQRASGPPRSPRCTTPATARRSAKNSRPSR